MPRTKSDKPASRRRSKKSAPVEEPVVKVEPVPEPVVVEEPVVAEAPAEEPQEDAPSVLDRLSALDLALKALMDTCRSLRSDVKSVSSQYRSETRAAGRRRVRRATSSGPRQPSGITKPVQISSEFRKFIVSHKLTDKQGNALGKDELCSSTRGTSFIHNYVQAKGLSDGKFFTPDKALRKLLQLDTVPRYYKDTPKNREAGLAGEQIPVDKLTYSRLQTFTAPHFLREESVSA